MRTAPKWLTNQESGAWSDRLRDVQRSRSSPIAQHHTYPRGDRIANRIADLVRDCAGDRYSC